MATVQHGRRKGTPKAEAPGPEKSKEKLLILSSKEWQAIQDRKNKALPATIQLSLDMQKDRQEKHQQSVEQVSSWGNTIVGKRNKRLNARRIREEEEEIERQKLDIEEAEIKAAERRAAIEHAKKLQYYQTDRVKGFHGALLLSEVIKEREAQIELKKEIDNAMKNADDHLLQWERNQLKEAARVEKEKAEVRQREAALLRKTQFEQAGEKRKLSIAVKVQDIEEGKSIQKDVDLFHQENTKKAKEREQKAIMLKKNYDQHLELESKIVDQQKIADKQNDQEIRLYANAKRKMAGLRKKREGELFQSFQNHQQAMVDHLATLIKEQVDDEDSRIAKAVAERDSKRQAEEEDGKKKRISMQKDILKHRLETMTLNDQKSNETKKDQSLDLQRRITEDQTYFQEQEQRLASKKVEEDEVQSILVKQGVERSSKFQVEKHNELEADKRSAQMVKEEEDEFQRYADAVIDLAKQRGRPVGPLIKAKNAGAGGGSGPIFEGKSNLRPSYQANDAHGNQLPRFATGTAKKINESSDTSKRLGFVW
ncbi:cilia- and flagella- associated protein 210-like [Bolinopsis microptera]|uniref:cilia- and flagella- associated protein 210-like n=1 Tax=Bolinopsis microptera TaxID=2820187 RepID=UPI00307A4591